MKWPEDVRVDTPRQKDHAYSVYADFCTRCKVTGLQLMEWGYRPCPAVVTAPLCRP